MAASPADLETRVAALEARQQRTDEDLTSIMDTVLDTREDVKTLRRDMGRMRLDLDAQTRKIDRLTLKIDTMQRGINAIVAHLGLTIEPDNRDT